MAQSSHQRIVVGLPFPVLALQNFLHLFADADTRCIFLHVLSPKRDDPVDAEDLQNKLAASLQQRPESIAIRRGDFLDELLAFAAEAQADLLLVSPPATGKPRVLARRLAMKAPCSVWMAPEGSPISSSNILVPVDFSSRSEDALRRAAEIASLQGRGWITALHVYFDEAVVTYEGHQEVVRLKEESQFETFLSRIDLGDVRVRTRWVESSHVAETILRTATEIGAGLIVMGTRGRSRSAGVLIGSETDRVLAKSTIPVLAVKRSGANLGLLEALLDRRFHRKDEAHFG